MKVAFFDCFSGIAGDMALAALLDAGADFAALKRDLASLQVEGWDIHLEDVLRSGIHAKKVHITLHGVTDDQELAARSTAPTQPITEGTEETVTAETSASETPASEIPSGYHHFANYDVHNDHAYEHVYLYVSESEQAAPALEAAPVELPEPIGGDQLHDHLHSHYHEAGHDQLNDNEHSHEHGDTHDHHHHAHAHEHDHDHEHSHDHDHDHPHDHDHAHGYDHAHGHHHHHHDHDGEHSHGRSMAEIRELIENSALSARVKRDSLAIFEKIAVAEAYLHHSTPDDVHFHEIGGVDSLLDIVGVAWCLENLGVEAVYCSALPHSTGFVKCAHGLMPVPAPATLEILKGAPWFPTDIRGELVTPTGAGIVGALAKQYGAAPAMTIHQIGLGAGTKELEDRPNILRISIGEVTTKDALDDLQWQQLTLWEANVDDMNPQFWEIAFERIFAAGALDVWLTPIAMKKGRPAQLLSALCAPDSENSVLRVILKETTSLGARRTRLDRAALPRDFVRVPTPWGEVSLKIARWPSEGTERPMPEWDEVKRLAEQNQVPARQVYEAALHAFSQGKSEPVN